MPSSQPNAPDADRRRASAWAIAAAATTVAAGAFALYYATLLPGVDFGDTGSFQTTIGSPILTPCVGYPLYFAIAGAFLHATGLEPARALNLLTAIQAAVAIGVIAEVYALHVALMLAALLLILRWERRPTMARLAAFFACVALAFGNHLSTVLLLPAFTLFLFAAAPGGWRAMVAPRVVLLAVALAAAGAAQYLWNLRALWFLPDPPRSVWDALRTFWFDVTKSDWRDTMVLEVPRSLLSDHAAMYWFDLRQQFGTIVPLLAAVGAVVLWRSHRSRAALIVVAYAVTTAFAFSYNVGDSHVFYLPSHVMVALMASCAVAAVARDSTSRTRLAAMLLLTYAAVRGYRDFPALDRSADTRPLQVLNTLTEGLDDQRAVLLVDLNWQVANGLSYYGKSVHPEIAVGRARDVLLYAPALIRDNAVAGRQVAASEQARRLVAEAYGPLVSADADVSPPSFATIAANVARGTRYALTVVKQSRDMPIDRGDLAAALRTLAPGAGLPDPLPAFFVVAGQAGSPPAAVEAADRPFARTVEIDGTRVELRMEAWMASDTIRRMGFGHVIANRHHTLIVERGISFAAFDRGGAPLQTEYFSSIFTRPSRYLIRTAW